ncbi:uncharacterized protein LOC142321890 [Lycorma delicatula]|uniref:uncharacterized protein LOC142321890 n=1 Tax=Lycorma delicatula TaxID=130591 RepID=UPI003F511245
MASKRHSPIVGQTWHHASTPLPIETAAPDPKRFSPLPSDAASLMPAGDCSWSGDWKQLFADTISSDWPGQSAASSASWSDELENDSTKRLSEQYEILESALYGDSSSDLISNPNLAAECKQWKERFPHLRAVGVGIKGSSTEHLSSIGSPVQENEEVIASHGKYKEASVHQIDFDKSLRLYSSGYEITDGDVNVYKERVKNAVLEKIFSRIWPNVIKRIDPVFKKLLERNKLSLQLGPKICIDGTALKKNCDSGFCTTDKFLRVSPMPLCEASAKNSVSRVSSPAVQNKPCVRDGSVPQVGQLNVRISSSTLRNSSNVKLVPPVVFPSGEKLLSPIPAETRNVIQSARNRKKMSKNNCPSGKSRLIPQSQGQTQEEGRFCVKDESRTIAQGNIKKSARGYWSRHGMLPPISSKENITSSAVTQRSTSALLKLGKPDVETRPNTSVPNKNGVTLLPLNEGNKKKSRIELAQEWLEKQLSPANGTVRHLSTYADINTRWRSHHSSHRK